MTRLALTGARVFDGAQFLPDAVVVLDGPQITAITDHVPAGIPEQPIEGILAPGLIDLQVNGGDGLMVGGDLDAAAIARICAAHARLGATGILPTLITDTPAATAAVIAAGIAAIGTPGFLGLHLEGPHLDPRRKGAHDAALIRPMTTDDCEALIAAAGRLPALMVTLAPEAVTLDQIARLSAAGVIVSLGHSDTGAETAKAAFTAGARVATHLFNAMSGLAHREPGLVGAVLAGQAAAGLIADGHHVLPDVLRVALAARPTGLFLVSDAMAVAGTDAPGFTLGGREILRQDGRLLLADGTLAGADLTLPRAIALLVQDLGLPLERALAMATAIPAAVIGAEAGHLTAGARADLVHLSDRLTLAGVWQSGQRIV